MPLHFQTDLHKRDVIPLAEFKARVKQAIANGDDPLFDKLMEEFAVNDFAARRICHVRDYSEL